MDSLVFTNARIVGSEEVINGTLVVDDKGNLHAIDSGNSHLTKAIDCQGDYLVPGMVELHTDNLEKHFTPRPGVNWPARSAVVTHDNQIVAAGITTVFDALALGDVIDGSCRLQNLQAMVDALAEAEQDGVYRADHFLHLRCEVSCESSLPSFESLVGMPMVRLVSIMDHSPGQRQFVKEEKYREYYQGKYNLSDLELDNFIVKQRATSARFSRPYRDAISSQCHHRGIPLASHDDATLEHARESAGYNMSVAEFPTTTEAAKASHELGLSVMMGAPNVVRGGSHSGNVAASDLAREGVLDILSSDYYPSSLLDAAFMLAEMDNPYSLPDAIRTVSSAPATSVGLDDRGILEAGKRADIVRLRSGKHLYVQQVWKRGERVF